jgi:Reverse transcriptase (RNA-dependent DNA polymerase)
MGRSSHTDLTFIMNQTMRINHFLFYSLQARQMRIMTRIQIQSTSLRLLQFLLSLLQLLQRHLLLQPHYNTHMSYTTKIIVEKPPHTVLSIEFGPLSESTSNSFADTMNRPDSRLWWEALCNEIRAVIQNDTWSLVDLPQGKRAISLKWVFKVERDARGNFEKYKARIVVKGYSQVAGLDFNETFAPVVKAESIGVLFGISAANDLYILYVDCQNAFLHGQSDTEIYVLQPEGFVDPHFPQCVLCLNKSLYGLKQASTSFSAES